MPPTGPTRCDLFADQLADHVHELEITEGGHPRLITYWISKPTLVPILRRLFNLCTVFWTPVWLWIAMEWRGSFKSLDKDEWCHHHHSWIVPYYWCRPNWFGSIPLVSSWTPELKRWLSILDRRLQLILLRFRFHTVLRRTAGWSLHSVKVVLARVNYKF
jgi:hypothetical protein